MTHRCLLFAAALILATQPAILAADLHSGEFYITQSWSQEADFQRLYLVHVPENPNDQKLPVFIFLHGNGGNAKGAQQQTLRRYPTLAKKFITVFADGYLKSWNIVSERSKADDRGFIETIVQDLAKFDNVRPNSMSIMGVSNGAALVNQLAIESQLPNIRTLVTSVSPLNTFQHDGKNFRAMGQENNYTSTVTPPTGRRLMNISGTEDKLVPYHGGASSRIPAKDGKLAFVAAEESIYLWALQMGYKGPKHARPNRTLGDLEIFSYLNGDVIHYKAVDQGHGATRAIDENTLLEFLAQGLESHAQ